MSIQLVKIPLFGKEDSVQSALDSGSDRIAVSTPAVMSKEPELINSKDPSTWDSPEARLASSNAQSLFLTKEQLKNRDLNLTESNGGVWNARI